MWRVVLSEVANAQQAVQRAARLVAMQQPGLRVAHRQIAVGVRLQQIQLAVTRAVHRLERHLPVLGLGDEHVVVVLVPVA